MKIKITKNVPVDPDVKPILGEEYEVIEKKPYQGKTDICFVMVNGTKVGILSHECTIVEE